MQSELERPLSRTRSKAELNARLIPKIALVVIASCEGVSEASQQILELRWPDGDMFAQRDVDASADEEVKRIIAWGFAGNQAADNDAAMVQIPVKITVRTTEHGLDERFKMRHSKFHNRPNIVGEQVALRGNRAW
jgi:hypothetical protein